MTQYLGYYREWKIFDVVSIVYMIQGVYFNRNVDTDEILSLMADLVAEYFMDAPSTSHMR